MPKKKKKKKKTRKEKINYDKVKHVTSVDQSDRPVSYTHLTLPTNREV